MTIYLGIDDTDTRESRGTGRLARSLATELAKTCLITGVTRHQLFVHDAIPFTSHNSAAVIHVEASPKACMEDIFGTCREMMISDFIDGSDPGICIASRDQITPEIISFGHFAKRMILTQEDAYRIATEGRILLEGLGGTNDGIIGALAGVGLAASGNDGRFILRGKARELVGRQDIRAILCSGVDEVKRSDGTCVTEGTVDIRKVLRPALIQGKAVLFVEGDDGRYRDCVIG
jgi:tRNA(Ile2) C34 agmatinyltransferase TiaS